MNNYTTQNKPTCCEKCRASERMIPEMRAALEKISPPGRACWADNCPCHTTQTNPSEEWESRFDVKFDEILAYGPGRNIESIEHLVKDFIRETRKAAYQEGVRHGEGTGNCVQRYQMGYEEGRHADCKIHFEDGVAVGRRLGIQDSLEAVGDFTRLTSCYEGFTCRAGIRTAISTLLK